MNWLATNLVLLLTMLVINVALFAGVVIWWRKNKVLLRTSLILTIGFTIAAAVGFRHLTRSTPGLEDTDKSIPTPKPLTPSGQLAERLRSDWHSEDSPEWPVVQTLALLCKDAYNGPIFAKQKSKEMGFQRFEVVADNSMIGYVACVDDIAVVIFRGTDNKIDWLANVDIRSIEVRHGRIHSGFQSYFQPMREQVLEILRQQQPKYLWLTGHSLGGAQGQRIKSPPDF